MSAMDNAYQICRTYLGIKLHYDRGSSYDFSVYGPRKLKPESFEKRSDRYRFLAIANKIEPKDAVDFFSANALRQNKVEWIGKLTDSEAFTCHRQLVGRQSGFSHHFKREVKDLVRVLGNDPVSWITKTEYDLYPPLVQRAMDDEITPETYTTLVKILDVAPKLHAQIEDIVIWPAWSHVRHRYGQVFEPSLVDAAKALRAAL